MTSARLKNFFFILLGAVIIIFLVWMGILYIAKMQVEKLAEEVRSQSTESQKKENISYVKKLVEETSSGREVINSYFLEEGAGLSLIEKVTEAARVSKVTFKIDRVEEKEGIKIHLTAGGTFSQLSHFLILLENLPYHTRLEGVKLKKHLAEGGGTLWSGDFLIMAQNSK